MAKAKKAAPKKTKAAATVNITKRKSFKRATSTPLSKSKLSVGVSADSPTMELLSKAYEDSIPNSKNKIAKGAKNPNKSESIIIETPKRLTPRKGVKRGGPAINSTAKETSPKKLKRAPTKKGKSANKTVEVAITEKSTVGRSTRKLADNNTNLTKHAIKTFSPKHASPLITKGRKKKATSPAEPKLKRGAIKNSPVKSPASLSNNDVKAAIRGRKAATSPKKASNTALNKRKSKGVVATKAKRLSGAKPVSPKKRGLRKK